MKVFTGNKTHPAIKICVDVVKDDIIFSGRISAKEIGESVEFCDIHNLLLGIEKILNNECYPDAGKSLRRFKKDRKKSKQSKKSVEQIDAKIEKTERRTSFENYTKGKIVTMILYVTQRNYATWQGRVCSIETGKVMNFKSELDFLKNVEDIIQTTIENSELKTAL